MRPRRPSAEPSLFIHCHPRIAQRPFADHLAAARDLGIACHASILRRALYRCLAIDEHGTVLGVRRHRQRCQQPDAVGKRHQPSLSRASAAPAERHQLGFRDLPPHRRHAAIGGGDDVALGHEFRHCVDHLNDIIRRFHRVAGDIDDAGLNDLALQQREQIERDPGIAAFDRNLLDRAGIDRGEDLLILPPLAPERLLPVGIGLDAVAVADVHGGGAGEARGGTLQSLDAPIVDLVHVDVEGGLIELDEIDAVGLQGLGFRVQEIGEGKGHLHPIAIIAIGDGVDDGHRAGQGEFQLLLRVRPRHARFEGMDAVLELQRRDHLRHHRLIAILSIPISTLCAKSMPSIFSRKPCTKCCRACSPSVTMSMPASSWTFSQISVASRLARSSSSPFDFQGAQSMFGSASHSGFGKEPAMVVGNSMAPSASDIIAHLPAMS